MTEELGPNARSLLSAAREGLSPDAAIAARVRAKVATTVGGAAAGSAAVGTPSSATAASAGTSVIVKLAGALVIAGIVIGAGVMIATRRDTPRANIDAKRVADSALDRPNAGLSETNRPTGGQPNVGQPNAGQTNVGQPNAGQPNAGQPNAGQPNAGPTNAGQSNAGPTNAGPTNAGQANAGPPNAGPTNAGPTNAGPTNIDDGDRASSEHANAGQTNVGQPRSGHVNAGQTNTGQSNGGPTNAGPTNAGPTNAGPTNAAHKAQVAGLAREVELIDLATRSLRQAKPQIAIDAVREFERETAGKGQLAEEAAAIEIEALCQLHDATAATKLDAFDLHWPTSAQRSRLTAKCTTH